MFNLKDNKSIIFRIVIPVIQVLVLILLLLSFAVNNIFESLSDILKLASIALMSFISIMLGIRELILKKNRILGFLYLGVPLVVFILIIYLNIKY